jgi:hypothetical protein
MPSRVLILEPSLIDETGHTAIALRRFVRSMAPANVTIAANRRFRGSIAGAHTLPTFSHTSADINRIRRHGHARAWMLGLAGARVRSSGARLASEERGIGAGAAGDPAILRPLFADEVDRAIRDASLTSADTIFVPSADSDLLLACTQAYSAALHDGPRMAVRIMYDDASWHREMLSLDKVLCDLRLMAARAHGLRVLAETDAMARHIEHVSGLGTVGVLRHPAPAICERVSGDPPPFRVFIPGQGRADQGIARLRSILEALERQADDASLKFEVLLTRAVAHELGRTAGLRIDITTVDTATEYAYRDAWSRTHIALFMHDERVFARRGSGLVVDAVAAGVPYAYPARTSLGELGRKDNGRPYMTDADAAVTLVAMAKEFGISSEAARAAQALLKSDDALLDILADRTRTV